MDLASAVYDLAEMFRHPRTFALLETQLLFAERRGFADADVLASVFGLADEVGRLLTGLHRRLVTMQRAG